MVTEDVHSEEPLNLILPHPSQLWLGLLTWIHFQLKTHQGVQIPSRVPHTPISSGVLNSEGLHGDVDHLGLGIILHRVAGPIHPAPDEAGLALLLPDLAPSFALSAVPAVLVGTQHSQRLPFPPPHFLVHILVGGTWGDRTF